MRNNKKNKIIERHCIWCDNWSFIGAWDNGVCPICEKQNNGLAWMRDRYEEK